MVQFKMPTDPYPKPTLTFTLYLEQNVGFGEGEVGGQFPRILCPSFFYALVIIMLGYFQIVSWHHCPLY